MAKRKMVLFDWDGTLVDNTPLWHKSISKIFETCGVKTPSIAEYFERLARLKSIVEVYRSFGINLSKEELDKIYAEEFQKYLNDAKLAAGARETLGELQKQKVVLGIVTAQVRSVFDPIFSRLLQRKRFKHVITDVSRKSSVISYLCADEEIDLSNCYYVGDTPSDILNAKQAGVHSIAYLTPHIPKKLLSSAEPDFMVSNLRDIPLIVKEN